MSNQRTNPYMTDADITAALRNLEETRPYHLSDDELRQLRTAATPTRNRARTVERKTR